MSEHANPNATVGTLVDVTGEYFTARLIPGIEDSIPESDRARIGQVGSYLSVKHLNQQTLVTVESSYQVTDNHDQVQNMLRLTPVGDISATGDFTRGTTCFPPSGSTLEIISRKRLAAIFSSHSRVGYKVGRLTNLDDVDVYLNAASFFGRHAAILGQSGAGKSWTVTSLVQSALTAMPNAHIVLLDMHGEYSDKQVNGTVATSPFPAAKTRSLRAQDLEFPYWLLAYPELCELIIDPADENAAIQLSFIRSVVLRLKQEANAHLDLGHITVDSPLYYSMEELLKVLQNANTETSDFGKTKSPLYGCFDQLLVRVNSLLNDTRYDFLMKPSRRVSTESLPRLMEDLVGLGDPKAAVTVLDLSAVPFDVVPMVTAQIGRLVYEFNFWNPLCREFPLFLICEEAHEYIPRENIPRYREARRSMERIAKNGRKYGVGLCVVSQRPADVSETVLAQCSSYICLRITNPNDQEYVRSMVPDAAKGTFAALSSLAKGEAVALGEAVPMPVRFQVDIPDPPPNSQDVDYSGKWSGDAQQISVETLVNNWHRQMR